MYLKCRISLISSKIEKTIFSSNFPMLKELVKLISGNSALATIATVIYVLLNILPVSLLAWIIAEVFLFLLLYVSK
jgi:hypothetical protein